MKSKNSVLLSGVKVLVVDDEQDALEITKLALAFYQAEVFVSLGAAEGLEKMQVHEPDVIVSDISMPGMDGYQFIRTIRNLPAHRGKHTPAVALTAFNRAEDVARATDAGFQKHLCKPVNLMELIETVSSLAGKCQL